MTTPGSPDRNTIQIDSKTYYLAEDANGPIYGTVALGRDLKESWDFQALSFGMGETTKQTPAGYYFTDNMDLTKRGLRVGPKVVPVALGAGDIPTGRVGFFFETLNSAGTRMLYFYCAKSTTVVRITKINPSTDAVISGISQPLDITVGAATNVNAGRPEAFDSYRYICLGIDGGATSASALSQLTTCVSTSNADTWTNIDVASAYDTLLASEALDGRSQLIRTNGNDVQLCASPNNPLVDANWAPVPGHNVGVQEAYRVILGGTNAGGIVYMSKAEGLFTFDSTGNSWPVIPTLGGSAATSRYCTLCAAFGDMVFYGHRSGVWRTIGLSRTVPCGPDSIDNYAEAPNISPPIKFKSYSVAFQGKWIYFDYTDDTNNNNSYILACNVGPHPSGHPLIIHTIVKRSNEIRSLYIDAGSKLWWSEPGQNRLAYIQLGTDGSPNSSVRGAATTATYEWYSHEIDFGEPEITKQMRYAFLEIESGDSTVSWQLKAYRDSGSAETVGSPVTTTQANNINWTVGTTDTARRLRLRLTVTGTGDHDAADAKALRLVVYARTADIMRVVLTEKNPRGKRNRFDIAKIIRKLKNAGPITIREPFTNETHTAYVTAVNEVAAGIEVVYERWQIAA